MSCRPSPLAHFFSCQPWQSALYFVRKEEDGEGAARRIRIRVPGRQS
jgi:hypothetical protein